MWVITDGRQYVIGQSTTGGLYMRLIDADALFHDFENAAWCDNNDRDFVAEDILMDAPTIDPERHGRWIDYGMKNSTGYIYQCSGCDAFCNPNRKDVLEGRSTEKPHYCPCCGAKMDEDY